MLKRLLLPALVGAGLVGPARAADPLPRPKLVVGIVVDQMRYDYLYRYWDKYPAGGFRRLLAQGFSYENCHYNYVPTYTGPGHASIYTGTTPSTHGIVGNNWWVREAGAATYVTEDKTVEAVGGNAGSAMAGQQSPRYLLATTITDELRLASNFRSKVIGVCIKDRGSILPAGHAANAAYWYDGASGHFISSTFYMKALPDWAAAFNARNGAAGYLRQPWQPLLPLAQYTESTADDVPWEAPFRGEARPVFPHNLPALGMAPGHAPRPTTAPGGTEASNLNAPAGAPNYGLLSSTPFGNSLTLDFALEALRQEGLGQRPGITDFLALSFSSTDYVGHQFGPNSIEVEDTYLRLDRDLARLLAELDQQVGAGQALVFLTADHGAAHSPDFLRSQRLPAGAVGPRVMQDSLQRRLTRRHGPGAWVLAYENQQVYLNRPLIAQKGLSLRTVQDEVVDLVADLPGVSRALTADDVQKSHWESGLLMYLENGYYPKRCGDVLVVLEPGWLESHNYPASKGTTHGSASAYDTHVPLLFWGWHVPAGRRSSAPARIVDIAPTVAQLLRIQEPSGCTGTPLVEVLK